MNEDYVDSIAMAAQLGRLDFVSALLGGIGVLLVLGGIYGFFNFRAIAKSQATEVAKGIIEETRKNAEDIAERTANEYVQENLPDIVEEYLSMSLFDVNDWVDDIADSQAQTEEEE